MTGRGLRPRCRFALGGFDARTLSMKLSSREMARIDLSPQRLVGLPLIGNRCLDCLDIPGYLELILNLDTLALFRFEPLVDAIGDGNHSAVDLSDLLLHSGDLQPVSLWSVA